MRRMCKGRDELLLGAQKIRGEAGSTGTDAGGWMDVAVGAGENSSSGFSFSDRESKGTWKRSYGSVWRVGIPDSRGGEWE